MDYFFRTWLQNRLHRQSLLSASVLVSLTLTLPFFVTNSGILSASAQTQTDQKRTDEALRLY
ncbi:hypothetical protein [Nostoc sp.]|uniref:hypothetical protein n=1 Tax=Nostoc sp. TaxID=1180 RepID=UPI002FFC8EEC